MNDEIAKAAEKVFCSAKITPVGYIAESIVPKNIEPVKLSRGIFDRVKRWALLKIIAPIAVKIVKSFDDELLQRMGLKSVSISNGDSMVQHTDTKVKPAKIKQPIIKKLTNFFKSIIDIVFNNTEEETIPEETEEVEKEATDFEKEVAELSDKPYEIHAYEDGTKIIVHNGRSSIFNKEGQVYKDDDPERIEYYRSKYTPKIEKVNMSSEVKTSGVSESQSLEEEYKRVKAENVALKAEINLMKEQQPLLVELVSTMGEIIESIGQSFGKFKL